MKQKVALVVENQQNKNRVPVAFRVKKETEDKLKKLAEEDERSQGQIVDYAIEEYYAKYKK